MFIHVLLVLPVSSSLKHENLSVRLKMTLVPLLLLLLLLLLQLRLMAFIVMLTSLRVTAGSICDTYQVVEGIHFQWLHVMKRHRSIAAALPTLNKIYLT